jgi:hypothetical protein
VVLLLFYVNLATTILMFGALGLINRVEPQEGKPAGAGGGPQWIVAVFLLTYFYMGMGVLGAGASILSRPLAAALIGLPTPLPSFFGLVAGDPLLVGLSFFDYELPFLFVTPLVQLGIVVLCFQYMARQLINPLNPPFSKRLSYLVLIGVDVLLGGVLYDSGPHTLTLVQRVASFCLLHLLTSLWLAVSITPWKDTLHSWVWRFRGRRSALPEAWLGDRSENTLALITFCLIGAINLLLLVLLPGSGQFGWQAIAQERMTFFEILGLSVVVLLTFGFLFQWIMSLGGRGNAALMGLLVVFPVALPHIFGSYYKYAWLEALSPSAHFFRWLGAPLPPLPIASLLLLYGLLWGLMQILFHRRQNRLIEMVQVKLQQMGVHKT